MTCEIRKCFLLLMSDESLMSADSKVIKCLSFCLSAAAQLLSLSEPGLCRSSSAQLRLTRRLLLLFLPRAAQTRHLPRLLCPRSAADRRGGSPHHDLCCHNPHSSRRPPVLGARGAAARVYPVDPQQRGGLSREQRTDGGWVCRCSVSDYCDYYYNMSPQVSCPVSYDSKSRVLLPVFTFCQTSV